MSSTLRVRLRTQGGDLGPVDAAASETVGNLKSKFLSDWGRLAAEAKVQTEVPASTACLKLILNGKFLDDTESLADLHKTLTDPAEHSIITMHAIVRPQAALKSPAKSKDKGGAKGCSCVIC